MNCSLQSTFSLYKGSGKKKTNSKCDSLLSILQEPIPATPVILDFNDLNTHSLKSSMIELDSYTYYDFQYRKCIISFFLLVL